MALLLLLSYDCDVISMVPEPKNKFTDQRDETRRPVYPPFWSLFPHQNGAAKAKPPRKQPF
jgi:hypothetical protein